MSLSVIIDYQSEDINTKKTFIIEEPELNLFPASQNKLVQYLIDKTMNYGHNILITTHSPYTLTSLNNLIYAFNVGQSHNEEVKLIVDKKYWLNPADISAYQNQQPSYNQATSQAGSSNNDVTEPMDDLPF